MKYEDFIPPYHKLACSKRDRYFIYMTTPEGLQLVESWGTYQQAEHFTQAMNTHEKNNGRPQIYQFCTNDNSL